MRPLSSSFQGSRAGDSPPPAPASREIASVGIVCNQGAPSSAGVPLLSRQPALLPVSTYPGAAELTALLIAEEDVSLLELGVALELPVCFLLSQVPESDPRPCLDSLLQQVCPLSMETLATALESDKLNAWNIAAQVRSLAESTGMPMLTACNRVLGSRLVDLLEPLADSSEQLAGALGLNCPQVHYLLSHERSPLERSPLERSPLERGPLERGPLERGPLERSPLERSSLERGPLHRGPLQGSPLRREVQVAALVEQACCQPARTRSEWMMLLAQAGTGAMTLERIAQNWQLPLPREYDSWYDWLMSFFDAEQISTAVLGQHQGSSRPSVSLLQAWILTYKFAGKPTFALALNDATSPCLRAPADRQQAGLLALLYVLEEQGAESASWELLQRLARFELIAPEFARWMPTVPRAPETVSRRLQPCDLVCLVDWAPAQREAQEMAALLGVGADYERLECQFGHLDARDKALEIWRRVYQRTPGLETGHLVQLFRQFGKWALLERLTADANCDLQPCVPLDAVSARAVEFAGLADWLRQHPVLAQAFVDSACLGLHSGHSALRGTDPVFRMLNVLALDASKLLRFYAFLGKQMLGSLPLSDTGLATASNDSGNYPPETTREGCPYAFLCPISGAYMDDPVPLETDGPVRHFSQACLLQALGYNPCHPLTRAPLEPDAVPSVDQVHLLRIRRWRHRHPELEESLSPTAARTSD